VIGSGGACKSTFANRPGEMVNIEVIHLDSLYWNPGWVETPKQEWKKTVEHLMSRDFAQVRGVGLMKNLILFALFAGLIQAPVVSLSTVDPEQHWFRRPTSS